MEVSTAVKEFLVAKASLSPFTRRMYRQRLFVFAAWCKTHDLALEAMTARSESSIMHWHATTNNPPPGGGWASNTSSIVISPLQIGHRRTPLCQFFKRRYGDTANDGIVQISFTLPLPLDSRARETARRYAMLMGVSNPLVAHAEGIDKQFFSLIY